jgi:hypothetical protein
MPGRAVYYIFTDVYWVFTEVQQLKVKIRVTLGLATDPTAAPYVAVLTLLAFKTADVFPT